jgi:hypothetical protein
MTNDLLTNAYEPLSKNEGIIFGRLLRLAQFLLNLAAGGTLISTLLDLAESQSCYWADYQL